MGSKRMKDTDKLDDQETAQRRDKALLRALKMPPKPHDEIAGKSNKKPSRKRPANK